MSDFLKGYRVTGKGVPCTHTDMNEGKYYVAGKDREVFYEWYIEKIESEEDMFLQENIPKSRHRKMILDIDGGDYQESDIHTLNEHIQSFLDNFKGVDREDIEIKYLKNTRNPSKKHVHVFNAGKPISLSSGMLVYFIDDLGKELPCMNIDSKFTGLRIPGSLKKDGRKAGYYKLPAKDVNEFRKYCIGDVDYIDDSGKMTEYCSQLDAKDEFKVAYANRDYERILAKSGKIRTKYSTSFTLSDEENLTRALWIFKKMPTWCKATAYDSHEEWRNGTWAALRCGVEPEAIEKFMSNFEGYIENTTTELCRDFNPEQPGPDISYLIARMYQYAPELKDAYIKKFYTNKDGGTYNPYIKLVAENTSLGLQGKVNILTEILRNDVKVNAGNIYRWDADALLWKNDTRDDFNCFILCILQDTLLAYADWRESKADTEEKKESEKAIRKTYLVTDATAKAAAGYTITNCKDEHFHHQMQKSTRYHLPIRGGRKVNLRTGEVTDRTKGDIFTKELDVDIGDSNSPDVQQFFGSLHPEKDRQDYVQEVFGYSMAYSTKFKGFFVIYGTADNGKTALVNVVENVLEEYLGYGDETAIQKQKQQRAAGNHTSYMAVFEHNRVVVFTELADSFKLDIANIKRITGGDKITIRHAHSANYQDFIPGATLFMTTNNFVDFDCGQAINNRVHQISCETRFTDEPDPEKPNEKLKDPKLVERLMKGKGKDDVFAYLIEGSIRFWKRGAFVVPEVFVENKREMIEEVDTIGEFIEENIIPSAGDNILFKYAFARYNQFMAELEQDDKLSRNSFYKNMKGRGIAWKKINKGLSFTNVKLAPKEIFDGDFS